MRTSEDELVRGTGWPVATWDSEKVLLRKAPGVAVQRVLNPPIGQLCTEICVCMCVCVYKSVYIYMCVCMYKSIYVYT